MLRQFESHGRERRSDGCGAISISVLNEIGGVLTRGAIVGKLNVVIGVCRDGLNGLARLRVFYSYDRPPAERPLFPRLDFRENCGTLLALIVFHLFQLRKRRLYLTEARVREVAEGSEGWRE
jgi:hypothetical protein